MLHSGEIGNAYKKDNKLATEWQRLLLLCLRQGRQYALLQCSFFTMSIAFIKNQDLSGLSRMKYALFPLNIVMFPGSLLPLQIFEQRYLNLIKQCMKQQTGFVTVLISAGKEVGDAPQIYSAGCYVEIIDWDALSNGLLGIKIQAKHRVRLCNSTVRDDGLLFAKANSFNLALNRSPVFPDMYKPLLETLKLLLEHPFAAHYKNKVDYNDAADICNRLSELLPISNKQKQRLLETENLEQVMSQLVFYINSIQK